MTSDVSASHRQMKRSWLRVAQYVLDNIYVAEVRLHARRSLSPRAADVRERQRNVRSFAVAFR
ncbi:hypothetical protein BDZ89DRAFT_1062665, partial [Hymenopellis radicata]